MIILWYICDMSFKKHPQLISESHLIALILSFGTRPTHSTTWQYSVTGVITVGW